MLEMHEWAMPILLEICPRFTTVHQDENRTSYLDLIVGLQAFIFQLYYDVYYHWQLHIVKAIFKFMLWFVRQDVLLFVRARHTIEPSDTIYINEAAT